MLKNNFRALVRIEQHNVALLFTNYLASININAHIENEDEAYVIYCNESLFEQAKQEFDQFIQQPFSPKYQKAAWDNGVVSQVSHNGPSLLQIFREQFLAHAGLVTLITFAVCWIIFLLREMGFGPSIFEIIKFYPTLSSDALLQEPYRLIGPAFYHFSWLHIVFNTMWWWYLGGSIEKVMGKWQLLNILLISAIISNIAQFLASGNNFGGLSGVVYALVGYVWWMKWLVPEKGLEISKSIVGFLIFWIVLGYMEILPINMGNTSHLSGLICGCLLALFYAKISNTKLFSTN
ncbi:MAG: rhomboid family intramembrane serine protease GlpG [Alteromonadaceae bacterium]|nr:rhomboid family intramembrane serine protease GlpG [Alteromonadaceae bacterium]